MIKYAARLIIKLLTRFIDKSESKYVEAKPVIKIKLEPTNFRVSSEGWTKQTIGSTSVNFKDTLEVLRSPCGGIIEFLYDEDHPHLHREQLFRWDAAMEAVKKANKRIPSKEQFETLTKKDLGDISYVGYVDKSCHYFWYQKIRAYFWTSTVSSDDDSNTTVYNYGFQCDNHKSFSYPYKKDLYWSVRCIDPTSAYDS